MKRILVFLLCTVLFVLLTTNAVADSHSFISGKTVAPLSLPAREQVQLPLQNQTAEVQPISAAYVERTVKQAPTGQTRGKTVTDQFFEVYRDPTTYRIEPDRPRFNCYHIPQFNLPGDTATQTNQIVFNELYSILEKDIYPDIEHGKKPFKSRMSYWWGENGAVVSAVVRVENDVWDDFYIYNVSKTTGMLLNHQEFLEALGMTAEAYRTLVADTLERYWKENDNQNLTGPNRDFYLNHRDELYSFTMTQENMDASLPYVNEDGELGLLAWIYSAAGAEKYRHNLSTVGPVDVGLPTCGIDHSQDLNGKEAETSEKTVPYTSALNFTKSSIVGHWSIDAEYTMDYNHTGLTYMYGSGYKYGNSMTFNEDGSFSYYVGITEDGEGTYEVENNLVYITSRSQYGLERNYVMVMDSDGRLYDPVGPDPETWKYVVFWKKDGGLSGTSVPSAADSRNETLEEEALSMSEYSGALSRLTRLSFSRASASSELWDPEYGSFPASLAIDSDISTSWQEGVTGDGKGENLTLFFNQATEVSVLQLYTGFTMSEYTYQANSRPRELRFDFSDGSSCSYTLSDRIDSTIVALSRPVTTSYITITIVDTFPGEWLDTAISEVYAFREEGFVTVSLPNTGVEPNTVSISAYSGTPSVSDRVQFSVAMASSVFPPQGTYSYSPNNVIRDDVNMPWVENDVRDDERGNSGNGIGENITLFFSGQETISVLGLHLGFANLTDEIYYGNNRPRTLRFDFSDGSSAQYEFLDLNQMQYVQLSRAVTTTYVKLTILSVYPSNIDRHSTCITSVRAYR